MSDPVTETIEATYRQSAPRIRATLVRLLGSFDLAEEALHDAFVQAAVDWPIKGYPRNPVTWLISAGRFRTIDRLRRRALIDRQRDDLAYLAEIEQGQEEEFVAIEDDMLRLVFTCCHPALPMEARIAMALREVCGLTTEEIARAFLTLPPTIAQRIVRAKARIRTQRIAYVVPDRQDLPKRLEAVLGVVYLLFNEGHARAGAAVRLSEDALHLARLLVDLLPDPECLGLLALILIQHSRRKTRLDPDGQIILLADQDRSLWDRAMIGEAETLLERIRQAGEIGTYGLQAAIAACHARAATMAETDWPRILHLYDLLQQAAPSPVVALNRAVALAEVHGAQAGLTEVERLLSDPAMQRYHATHTVAADLQRRLERIEDARRSYITARTLASQQHEIRFIEARLNELA
ncbi:RNA polymerase subunit sigma-24 [Rhizobium sp. Root274]|uniref:RNA polymerase sigma factor n=1 Tax=unclassified Rhizobium TaxID=2613769 RepID=UPI000715BA00|nr:MULTISPECIES: RNA polymerase sigma factor [unclassified Rhizobium]KQW31089.1 RNA polymerase subunit sigma-24 [Rhizobium sp. Root1240]KRD32636.1 RNA polymerase subunit sigma-24 [Rhizobium sp. Root274]